MSVFMQRDLAHKARLKKQQELDRRLFGVPTTPRPKADQLRIENNIVPKYVWDVIDSKSKECDWAPRTDLPLYWSGFGRPPRLYDPDSDSEGEWTWEMYDSGCIAGLGGSFIKDVQGWRRVRRAPRTRGSFSGNFDCMSE